MYFPGFITLAVMIIFIKYLLYARHHSDAKDIAVDKTNPRPHKTNIPGNGGGGRRGVVIM